MRRIEYFLSIIIFLLASIAYQLGDGNTPWLISVPVLILLFGTPLFICVSVLYELSNLEPRDELKK
ncbi:uncharacterized protein HQ_2274B [Haloquadratum walsbyi DSM 16790]|jgi:hypothetical protein|uniref:Uncharacterized protein n=1 Tax=Haloquadratum walsbyi (strain DSM 16790 / HBSQ001) TaxID=362976 RepID=A0A1X7HV39_HALWD|nr:uncharacterized protein HQ_2274B [Haloquadratum walsbyi DSM 16790]